MFPVHTLVVGVACVCMVDLVSVTTVNKWITNIIPLVLVSEVILNANGMF